MDTTQLREWKTVCEVRYPASPSLFDIRGKIVSRFADETMTKWSMARNRVDIHNEDRTIRLFASFHNSGVVIENPPNIGFFQQQTRRFLRGIFEELQISVIRRIGVRICLLLPAPDFEDLVNLLLENLYGLSSVQWRQLGELPIDVGFPLTLRFGENRANFVMGPMEKEQLQGFFGSQTAKDQLPDIATFVDFDYYRNDPDIRPNRLGRYIHEFVENACEEIRSWTEGFLQAIEG